LERTFDFSGEINLTVTIIPLDKIPALEIYLFI